MILIMKTNSNDLLLKQAQHMIDFHMEMGESPNKIQNRLNKMFADNLEEVKDKSTLVKELNRMQIFCNEQFAKIINHLTNNFRVEI